jgi:1-acyl-sn-glycerol-3-phosphate acyltransferase
MFRTLFVCSVIILYLLVLGPPLLLYSAVTKNTDVLYKVGLFGAKTALLLAGVKLVVTGKEKIPTGTPVVYMPNHQSNCDPPAVAAILPPVLIMAKKEFFKIPIMGTGMRMRGFIPVDRANREQSFAALEKATEALKAGHSFLVFPEGTRSQTGRLQPFKKGVFVMAIRAGAPIVPISVSGAAKIMPRGSFKIRPGTVRITIHDPVPTAGCTIEDRARVAAEVRRVIMTGLSSEEQPETD